MTIAENIVCPFCSSSEYQEWARENGYVAVRCTGCALIYVNPRPAQHLISEAVKTGVHSELQHGRTAIARRVTKNIKIYSRIVNEMFDDIIKSNQSIRWLDVGAGYGEFMEAVTDCLPENSKVVGLEPMTPKVINARSRGLNIHELYLSDVSEKYDVVSLMNVFSHIPDFSEFLKEIKAVLEPNGHFFMETGNIADLQYSYHAPTELDLPDHLVFAGQKHVIGFLDQAGFKVISIKLRRRDGIINFIKNVAKRAMGRTAPISIPYTSKYRTMLIRAQLT